MGDGPSPKPARPSVDLAAVDRAVDAVFAEDPQAAPAALKRTRAVIVLVGGRIVAERYAPGISKDTRLISWSMAKSFTNALVGILSGQGRLDLMKPAPVPEWADPADPRHGITIDMLLRMDSGLAFFENYTKEPISDVNRMLLLSPDFAAYAARKPLAATPGSLWNYSSGSTNIVTRILRASIGDDPTYWAFPRAALFGPLGMRSAEFGVDATGSFVGSSYIYATARDFARFGLLCLQDGIWEGKRILPEGWMRYATTPTAPAPKGQYGASFWLNAGTPGRPSDRSYPDMPTDLYYADGFDGENIFVCPSLDLVAVRLGMTWEGEWGSEAFLSGLRKALGK
jgi:CubicO group peptidase (beta-lactamase class C family)